MYNLINLGLVIGTVIGFPLWCGLVLALFATLAYRYSQRFRNKTIRLTHRLIASIELLLKRPLLSNITGDQGFPIQLEIFEQNLTARIQALLLKLRNSLKIHR